MTTLWVPLRKLSESEMLARVTGMATTSPWSHGTERAECPDCRFPLVEFEGVTDGAACMSCNTIFCIGSARIQ